MATARQTEQQQQHVDLRRKLALRRSLTATHGLGRTIAWHEVTAYVPFIGDGDIAVELYRNARILSADINTERVATAAGRLPGSIVRVADCDTVWPFPDQPRPIVLADFDAYAYPYDAFRRAWHEASWADRVVMFFTDGQRYTARRRGSSYREPDGTRIDAAGFGERQYRELFNLWYPRHVRPWYVDEVKQAGYRVVRDMTYLRDSMTYWGAVIQRVR